MSGQAIALGRHPRNTKPGMNRAAKRATSESLEVPADIAACASAGRARQEFANLLCAAAGDCDLCSPLKGYLQSGYIDDGEATNEIPGSPSGPR